MMKLIQVLWPSFAVAGVAEMVFFTVVNPQQLFLFGEPVNFSDLATYSIGFWLVCAASSLTTVFLQRSSEDLNRR